MPKQLNLFPELAMKLVVNLDEIAAEYSFMSVPPGTKNIAAWRKNAEDHFKNGAKTVLADIIDLLKKYTDLHEV